MILGFHLWDHILVIWLTVCDTGIAPCVHIFFTAVRWSLTVSSCPSKLHIRHCEWKVKVSPKVGCPCKEITFLGYYALIDFSHQVKLQRTPLGVWFERSRGNAILRHNFEGSQLAFLSRIYWYIHGGRQRRRKGGEFNFNYSSIILHLWRRSMIFQWCGSHITYY